MIQTVLFDIDGVILSEERCFDSSALAVWELLYSPLYLGLGKETFTPTPDESLIRSIRKDVFCNDQVLNLLKSRGFNSNWDMVYLTFTYQLVHLLSQLNPSDKHEALKLIENPISKEQFYKFSPLFPEDISVDFASFIKEFSSLHFTKGELFQVVKTMIKQKLHRTEEIKMEGIRSLWDIGREVFQEWYVGERLTEESIGKKALQTGKKGFLEEEIPLAPIKDLNKMFQWLCHNGYKIGIGTGRPAVETYEPLRAMGLLQWVDEERIVTSDDVLDAERLSDHGPLGKPHPFTYLQGYFGKKKRLKDVLEVPLPLKDASSILIVGDSVADFYAARSVGAPFAAVLTGLKGKAARNEFEKLGAKYILNDVLEVEPLLSNLK
ncbi:MAG: HAD family hydrolase [Tuberibacillus sp.]